MLVPDTSVVVKWFVAEEGQAAAERLIGEPLIAPDLLLIELANVGWVKRRKGEMTPHQVKAMLGAATSFVTLVPSIEIMADAFDIAVALDHAVYDCYFLALARATGTRLVTADLKFIKVCAGSEFEDSLMRLDEPS